MPTQTFFNLPEAKRRALLDAAIEEFAANDYENASISRVVARLGIAKGSIYQYFADKQDLFLYLIDLATQEKLAFVRTLQPPDPQMSIFAYMRWALRVNTHFELSHPRLSQVVYRALYGRLPFHDATIARLKEAGLAYFKELVRQGIAQGNIVADVDPEVAAFAINTLLTEVGGFILKQLAVDPVTLDRVGLQQLDLAVVERIFDQVVRILEYGLAAGRPDA